MAMIEKKVLENKLPDMPKGERIIRIGSPLLIKHCPENKKPATVEEFMKVCKEVYEVAFDTKQKKGVTYAHRFYRCLFDDKNTALKAQTDLETKMENQKRQAAIALYKDSRWQEDVKRWKAEGGVEEENIEE